MTATDTIVRHGRLRPGRTAAILVAALISLVVLLWCVFSVVQLVAHSSEQQAFTVAGTVHHVVVDLSSGSVSLRGVDRAGVSGTRRIEKGFRSPRYKEALRDDTLTVTGGCSSWMDMWCEVSYDLDVPMDVTVDAQSSAGSVRVSGVTGDLKLDSSAGSVSVDRSAGRLRLRSSAGSVTLTNSRSTHVTADSSAGGVRLAFLIPPESVVAESSAGSVHIDLPKGDATYRVSADSSAGATDVAVKTAPDSERSVRAASSAGSVHVRYAAAPSR